MMRFDLGGGGESFEAVCRSIGDILRRRREEMELSPEEVARAAHASPATVRRIESGELGPFSLGTLERIAHALDIHVDFDVVPRVEELLVLAAATDRPVRVYARPPADLDTAETDEDPDRSGGV